jgi:hypothetical protein
MTVKIIIISVLITLILKYCSSSPFNIQLYGNYSKIIRSILRNCIWYTHKTHAHTHTHTHTHTPHISSCCRHTETLHSIPNPHCTQLHFPFPVMYMFPILWHPVWFSNSSQKVPSSDPWSQLVWFTRGKYYFYKPYELVDIISVYWRAKGCEAYISTVRKSIYK